MLNDIPVLNTIKYVYYKYKVESTVLTNFYKLYGRTDDGIPNAFQMLKT